MPSSYLIHSKHFTDQDGPITKSTDLSGLVYHLSDDCEIYEISDSGSETYLGPISRKALLTIAADIAEFMINDYVTPGYVKDEATLALSYIRQAISGDLSGLDLKDRVHQMTNSLNVQMNDNNMAIGHGTYAILYWSHYDSGGSWFGQSMTMINYHAAGVEHARQGQYIIDFLADGKHLFLV
jgi:hypothetical protein